ncbi:hypothetical protein RRG08_066533 [Elysia crispata]|uniref:Uncharacterized protein n=1 Tax=Elysia crispata TaxID=231223 RepID=A0AAE0ZM74_9GAST|nr:hypothetical protein RRG08_066533 [Elysia crispata]
MYQNRVYGSNSRNALPSVFRSADTSSTRLTRERLPLMFLFPMMICVRHQTHSGTNHAAAEQASLTLDYNSIANHFSSGQPDGGPLTRSTGLALSCYRRT